MIKTRRRFTSSRLRVRPEHSPPRLERGSDGLLFIVRDDEKTHVRPKPCFPWSNPAEFISIRDYEDKELMLVQSMDDLDAKSRSALSAAIGETMGLMEIQRIERVERELEMHNWSVQTTQGKRTFQTKLDEWPRSVSGGGVIIDDICGDLYYIPDPAGLDNHSRKLLWAFVG